MKNDYLITERPLKALLIFASPMIIGNLFQQAYTMADSAVAGRYVSEQALAAIGASYALTTIFIKMENLFQQILLMNYVVYSNVI